MRALGSLCFTALLDALIHFPAVEAEESAGDDAGGFFERASAGATNDQVELVFRPRRRLPRIADTSVAHMTYRGAMTKPSLPAVRGNDLDPSQNEPTLVVPARGVHPCARRTMPVLRMRVSILHPPSLTS
jgi:hypothetical protein